MLFCGIAVLAVAFNSTGAAVTSLPFAHEMQHAYLGLRSALQSTSDDLSHGQNSGPVLAACRDALHSVATTVGKLSDAVHQAITSLFKRN